MSRSRENMTSLLDEIPNSGPKRPGLRTPSSGQQGPDQALPGQFCQPHCLTPGLFSSPTAFTDHLPLLRTFIRSSRIEPSSCNDPLSLPSRSIILRPACHQCCPGSVSCRINLGIGALPFPLPVSSNLRGSRRCSARGGLGRSTVGGRSGSPLSPAVTCAAPFQFAGSENLILLLAGRLEILSPSVGLLGGAGCGCLWALDMLMRLRGSNSSRE
jgi:hypothetical protein